MIPAVGLGAGGHARVVIDILRAAGTVEPAALLDPRRELWGTSVLGVPVVGDDEGLPGQHAAGVAHGFVGVGGVGRSCLRRRLYELLLDHGFAPVSAVHPRAWVSPSADVGPGVTIGAGAVVNAGARLGQNVLVNTGAIVEHDCTLGSHVHVASGACLAGAVEVGEGAHVGAAATVLQGVRIGERAVVGAGAVVVADVAADVTVAGIPARPLPERP